MTLSKLASELKSCGIRYAFGVSGSGPSLQLITELQNSGVEYYAVAHEGAAALMAGACCRDGVPRALSISIKGPGFANAFPGIVSNNYENRPALSVSEAYGDDAPSWRMHKRLDHSSALEGIVRSRATLSRLGGGLGAILAAAAREVPMPVHLDLAVREQDGVDACTELRDEPVGTDMSVSDLLRLIDRSSRPAVILGSLASRRLRGIRWDQIGVPIVTTASAKGCVDERSEFAGGVITGEVKALSPEISVLEHADLIVGIGLRNTEVIQPTAYKARLVIIDVAGRELHAGYESALVAPGGNLYSCVQEVVERLAQKRWGSDILRRRWDALERELPADGWLPSTVFRALEAATEGNAVITLDTGLFCTVGETLWRASAPGYFCGSTNGRFMGTSIPTALGISLSDREARVICVSGDGGIRPGVPEVRLAVEEKLPVLFILMSDGLYGSVALPARGKGLSARAYTIASPGWCDVFAAMGCPAQVVANVGELTRAAEHWLASKGPMFIETHFDPARYADSTLQLR